MNGTLKRINRQGSLRKSDGAADIARTREQIDERFEAIEQKLAPPLSCKQQQTLRVHLRQIDIRQLIAAS